MLDGTTGLNMLPQAREFNDVIFPIPVHLNWKCYLNIFYTLCFLKGCLHTSSTRNENMVLNPEIPLSRWHIISLLKSNICYLFPHLYCTKNCACSIWLNVQTQVVGITGLILTKLDGSARGGCVVCLAFSKFPFFLVHSLYGDF